MPIRRCGRRVGFSKHGKHSVGNPSKRHDLLGRSKTDGFAGHAENCTGSWALSDGEGAKLREAGYTFGPVTAQAGQNHANHIMTKRCRRGKKRVHRRAMCGPFVIGSKVRDPSAISAIDLNVKIILIGSQLVYSYLAEHEYDFKKMFKIKADFDYEMNRNDAVLREYARVIKKFIKNENLNYRRCWFYRIARSATLCEHL